MANLRRIRFTIAEWVTVISWEWHIPSFFFALFSFSSLPESLWILVFPMVSVGLILLQIFLRRDFRKLRSNAQLAKISHINDQYLLLGTGVGSVHTITREKIERVSFFKTDEITTDLICCEIEFQNNDQLEKVILSEDCENFESLETWIATLPSFDTEWRSRVVQPPFKENFTVAFDRGAKAAFTS